jgi:hypothetical protein
MDISTIAISLCSGILLTMISQFMIRGINSLFTPPAPIAATAAPAPAHEPCAMHDLAFSSLSREMSEVKTLLKDAHDEIFRRLRDVEQKVEVLRDRGGARA